MSGGTFEVDVDRVVGQPFAAVAARDLAAQHPAYGAIDIEDVRLNINALFVLQGRGGALDQFVVELSIEPVILDPIAVAANAFVNWRVKEDLAEVQPFRFPVVDGFLHVQLVDAADHVIELAEAEIRHDLPQLLGDEEEEIDDVLGLALELFPQGRVLRGDADGASVEVALAHHDAAQRHQRHSGETELLRPQQRGDRDVTAGGQLAVDLHANTAAQVVHHEHLLRLGKTQLPGCSRVANRADG